MSAYADWIVTAAAAVELVKPGALGRGRRANGAGCSWLGLKLADSLVDSGRGQVDGRPPSRCQNAPVGEDGCAGGDGCRAASWAAFLSDPWSRVRSARRKFCAAATSSSGWRRRAEARARHDGPSWQVFGPQSPDPVSEQ